MSAARHLTLGKLVRFGLVGVGATLLQYGIAAALHWGLDWRAALASGTGFALSAIANYWANARFTFEARGGHARSLPRFIVVAATGCALNSGVVELFERCQLNLLVGQIVATLLVFAWNFVLSAVWSFRVNADGEPSR